MACSARGISRGIQLIPFANQFECVVQMEHFTSPKKLQDAIACSQKCTQRDKDHVSFPCSEYCLVHPQNKRDLFCEHCTEEICTGCASVDHKIHLCAESSTIIREERQRISKTLNDVTEGLDEMKQKISGVKEMRQRVRNRENDNITVTREVFAALRKVIDDREEQIILSIKEAAAKREKALEVNL